MTVIYFEARLPVEPLRMVVLGDVVPVVTIVMGMKGAEVRYVKYVSLWG